MATLMLCGAVFGLHGVFLGRERLFPNSIMAESLQWWVPATPAALLLVGGLALGPSLLRGLLEASPMVALGEASYALYMLQWLPLVLLKHRALTGHPVGPAHAALAVAVSVDLALWCTRYVERPLHRRLRPHPVAAQQHWLPGRAVS